MKLDVSTKMLDLRGNAITEPKSAQDKTPVEITLRDVLINALTATTAEDVKANSKTRLKLFELAMKINQAANLVEIDNEDAVVVQTRVAQLQLGNLIVGQALMLMEGKEVNLGQPRI